MKTRHYIFTAVVALGGPASVFANDDDYDSQNTRCPSVAAKAIDQNFGAGTAANTTCLGERDDIAIVSALSNSTAAKSGAAQQLVNVNNMVSDYNSYYSMDSNDYKIIVVGYGAGARWLLTDAAYIAKVDSTATKNPSRALIDSLIAQGVKLYMCQNTMKANGYVPDDILANVGMVPAGVTSIIDFQMRGYTYINP